MMSEFDTHIPPPDRLQLSDSPQGGSYGAATQLPPGFTRLRGEAKYIAQHFSKRVLCEGERVKQGLQRNPQLNRGGVKSR